LATHKQKIAQLLDDGYLPQIQGRTTKEVLQKLLDCEIQAANYPLFLICRDEFLQGNNEDAELWRQARQHLVAAKNANHPQAIFEDTCLKENFIEHKINAAFDSEFFDRVNKSEAGKNYAD
jgi:hypothetical protein